MPNVRPTVSDVQRALGGLVRAEVRGAAGDDRVLQASEAAGLSPFVKGVVDGMGAGDHAVGAVVDAAMAQATAAWASVNQASGPGHAVLSKKEIARLDAQLALVTAAAARVARDQRLPPLDVHLDGAPAGVALTKSGAQYTLTTEAAVPAGSTMSLVVDGHALPLERYPAGWWSIDNLTAPAGYGIQEVPNTRSSTVSVLEITRDPSGWLKSGPILAKAKAGLTAYVKDVRIHDADWGDYFPTTWPACVQRGVPADIEKFFQTATVGRTKDTVLFVGRGPFDLYTEIEVNKRDGKIVHQLVEID